jgi:NDP-sugar pyrophosphorylase family protein
MSRVGLPRRAAILAGGFGTRLRPIVSDRPKVLAMIGGRPFVEYLLDQLAAAHIESVVLCTGYQGDLVRSHLGGRYRELSLVYSQETAPLGTGGALRLALPLLDSDHTLVMNGDSYFDCDLEALPKWHAARGSCATIVLAEVDETSRYGRVDVDEVGRILSFREKAGDPASGLVNAGVYLLQREFIASISEGGEVSLEREVFPAWVGRGLHGMRAEGRLWDIGVPNAYAWANTKFTASIRR